MRHKHLVFEAFGKNKAFLFGVVTTDVTRSGEAVYLNAADDSNHLAYLLLEAGIKYHFDFVVLAFQVLKTLELDVLKHKVKHGLTF